jgi:5-methyltetrahydropteroyltriglutamate--homocysteine methyltransferase
VPRHPPFRADHIGSLLRPPALRQAFRDHAAGTVSDEEFARIQDAAIREAVRWQEEIGLRVVTDGEFRRGSYWGRFVERTRGLAVREAVFAFRDDHGHEAAFTAPHVMAPVRREQPLALDEFAFLREVATATPKITLPAPSTLHFWGGRNYAEPGIYADARAFFHDVASIYRDEIAALAAAGCRYVQLDEVALAMLCDPGTHGKVRAEGEDPAALVDFYIDAVNQAVSGRPAEIAIGLHLCRGNFKGRYLAAGGYESVAEKLFAGAAVDHFLLEFDTPRAGDFAPLRFVAKDKGVVLGLVSSKNPALEPLDLLRRRVDEAARFVELDRLAISPQCGFASTVAGNPLTRDEERAKLAQIVAAARLIWGNA